MQLKDKVVFVTGGTRGIGSACAKAVLERGAKVVVTGINEEAGSKQADVFKEEFGPDKVLFIKLDVKEKNEFEVAFTKAVDEFGNIDVLINICGVVDEVEWTKMLEVNLKGVIHGTELANAHMRKDKGGRGGVIINIASFAGYLPFQQHETYILPVYTASKHAFIGYTMSLARSPDVEDQGIRYACVCPELVESDIVDILKSKARQEYVDDVPGLMPDVLVTPSQVGVAMVTLLEDDESKDVVFEVSATSGLARRELLVESM